MHFRLDILALYCSLLEEEPPRKMRTGCARLGHTHFRLDITVHAKDVRVQGSSGPLPPPKRKQTYLRLGAFKRFYLRLLGWELAHKLHLRPHGSP
jgi:hypothetical protein